VFLAMGIAYTLHRHSAGCVWYYTTPTNVLACVHMLQVRAVVAYRVTYTLGVFGEHLKSLLSSFFFSIS